MAEINLGKNIFWSVLSRFGAQILAVVDQLAEMRLEVWPTVQRKAGGE